MKHLIAVAVLALAGCASAAKTGATLDTWVGSQESELLASWGAPDRIVPMTDGGRAMAWADAWGTDQALRCEVTFITDAGGTIGSWSTSGNACASR